MANILFRWHKLRLAGWEAFPQMALVQLTCGIETLLSVIRRTRNAAVGMNLANTYLILMVFQQMFHREKCPKMLLDKARNSATFIMYNYI